MPAAYEFDLDSSTTGNGLDELLSGAVTVLLRTRLPPLLDVARTHSA